MAKLTLSRFSHLDPFSEKWIRDDNGHSSLMPYKHLPSDLKDTIGHSRYYAQNCQKGEPTAVYAHGNPVYATSWYGNHWLKQLRKYFKEDSSRFAVVNGERGVYLYKFWFFPYDVQFRRFHQIIVNGAVKDCHALLTKCEGGARATGISRHFFRHGPGIFQPDNLLWVSLI